MKATRMTVFAAGLAALLLGPRMASAEEGNQENEQAEEEEMRRPTQQPEAMPPAQRQGQEVEITPPPGAMAMPAEEEEEEPGLTPFGLGFAIGGGVADFADNDMDDLTDVGGTYDARLIVGTRLPVSLEAAYVGSAQDIEALGLDEDALLVSNGVEGIARLNLGNLTGTPMVNPFIFAGAGWTRYNVVNEDFNTSSVADEDDTFVVPVGVGISGSYRGLILDARASWRSVFNEDLVAPPAGSTEDINLHHWNATARIGFQF
ncbi:MAG: hypothetical protein HY698_05385 [Deltaproteobacteria bacterium]|nr:hypothetical protein [Deltaproteobacteria bacterium]